jgi:hypothetical protein
MAVITNYATLKTAIADYLARDDLTTFIPNFVQNAENKLYRALNLRNEETALSVSISSGVATVPSDFKALKFAYFDQSPVSVLQWMPIEDLYREYPDRTGASTPCAISREGSSFVFGEPSADGTLKGIYYAKQDGLETTDLSWYVVNAPEVLLFAALLEATPFIHSDERIPVWQTFLMDALDTLKKEQDNAEVSRGSLVQRVS